MSEYDHPAGDDPLALEQVAPATVEEWRRRTGRDGTGQAWTDYGLLLNHFAEALSRAPYTPEACESVNIVELVNAEFAYLAAVLTLIFPDGAMERKAYERVW